jgi:hypothetical protein
MYDKIGQKMINILERRLTLALTTNMNALGQTASWTGIDGLIDIYVRRSHRYTPDGERAISFEIVNVTVDADMRGLGAYRKVVNMVKSIAVTESEKNNERVVVYVENVWDRTHDLFYVHEGFKIFPGLGSPELALCFYWQPNSETAAANKDTADAIT